MIRLLPFARCDDAREGSGFLTPNAPPAEAGATCVPNDGPVGELERFHDFATEVAAHDWFKNIDRQGVCPLDGKPVG